MDFIVENYVWFVILAVVILMAVVGYIADKTGFIKVGNDDKKSKNNEQNDNNEVVNEEVEEPLIIENKGIGDLMGMGESEPAFTGEINTNFTSELANMDLSNEDLFSPLSNDTVDNASEVIDQSLFQPLVNEEDTSSDTTNVLNEEISVDNSANEIDSSLTPIDVTTLSQENETVSSDDDIWKY